MIRKINISYCLIFIASLAYVFFNTGSVLYIFRLSVFTFLTYVFLVFFIYFKPDYFKNLFSFPAKGLGYVSATTFFFYLFFLGFIIYSVVSLAWTRAPLYGIDKAYYLITRIGAYLILARVIAHNRYAFLKLNFFAFLFSFVLYYFLIGSPIQGVSVLLNEGFNRLSNSDGNPLSLGRYMGFGIITCYYFYRFHTWQESFKLKALALGAIIYAIVYLLLSGSRGPMVGLVGALVLTYVFEAIKTGSFKKILGLSSLGLGLFWLMSFLYNVLLSSGNKGIVAYINLRFSSEHSTGSFDARVEQINNAIQNLGSGFQMIRGAGLGDFGFLYYGYDARMYPHNIVIELLYELGIFGTGLFVLFSLVVMIKGFTQKMDLFGYFLVACLVNFLFNAGATSDLSGNFMYFAFCILFIHYKASIPALKNGKTTLNL